MNLIRLIKIEIGKLKRSKIGLILLIPVLLVWISGIMNADMNFEMQAEGISPENNFFIQSFLIRLVYAAVKPCGNYGAYDADRAGQ